jgi:8-oxo-dGTP pyrophosphatase MutT (NUDIX family)
MNKFLTSEHLRALLGRHKPWRARNGASLRQAVSFFLLVDREETNALLVKKKESPGYVWSAQIGMIGGFVEEEDPDHLSAAFREFEEELQIDRREIEVFGDLGQFASTVANANLHVFLARWSGRGDLKPDPNEIDHMVEVPLSLLAGIHKESGFAGANPVAIGRALVYPVDAGEIWGVTARVIHVLMELLADGEKR